MSTVLGGWGVGGAQSQNGRLTEVSMGILLMRGVMEWKTEVRMGIVLTTWYDSLGHRMAG